MEGIQGVWTALVTPFDDEGRLDLDAFRKLLHQQAEAGIHGVIPCGTTGEAPALSLDEKKTLITIAMEELADTQTKVIAGTGSNNYDQTQEMSQWASDAGVHGILVVTPYYNKPSQKGLLDHFRAIADTVRCGVVLYNVPSRTGVSMSVKTAVALSAHPRIVALKEATGQVAFTSDILDHMFAAGFAMSILSGDDASFFPLQCVGAEGVVSVTSNLCPKQMLRLYEATRDGDLERAKRQHWELFPLFRDLFVECNPVPVKYALAYKGLCRPTVRRPLAPLTGESKDVVCAALEHCRIPGQRP